MILVHSKASTADEVLTFAAAWDRAVPLVCVPMGRDQLDVAARVVYAGAGTRLRPRAKPDAIAFQQPIRGDGNRATSRQPGKDCALGADALRGRGVVERRGRLETRRRPQSLDGEGALPRCRQRQLDREHLGHLAVEAQAAQAGKGQHDGVEGSLRIPFGGPHFDAAPDLRRPSEIRGGAELAPA